MSYRITSLKAPGISDGSARTRSNWSGCAAKAAMALPMATTVESIPAATYWWMIIPQLSREITPRSAAAKIARPMLPSARSSALMPFAHSKSSPATGKLAIVRSFIGPSTLKAAVPQPSILSRTSPCRPMRSMTTARGSACASSPIASNGPRPASSATMASAFASMPAARPRSARGDRFSMRADFSRLCSGGSVARDEPASASFIGSLKATDFEENTRVFDSALRIGSYRVTAHTPVRSRCTTAACSRSAA